jgi:hypothetical protein
MTARSPLSVAEPWDLVADGYAAGADWAMAPFSRRAVQLARLDARSRVLTARCAFIDLTVDGYERFELPDLAEAKAVPSPCLPRGPESRAERSASAIAPPRADSLGRLHRRL